MLLGKQFIAFCLGVQATNVAGRSVIGGRTSRASRGETSEPTAYETTVTTEMGYYESESMSSKGRTYHDEYEYIPAPGKISKHSKSSKSGKKAGHHFETQHTTEPSEYASYTMEPTEDASYIGNSVKSGHSYEEEYDTEIPEYPSLSMEPIRHTPSKGSKGQPLPKFTHSPTHVGKESKTRKGSKGSKSSNGKSSKGSGSYDTPAPYPTPSESHPSTRPPSPVVHPTQPPFVAGSITASPTDSGSVPFELTPFTLLYETEEKRQASRLELAEVTDVTRLHLEMFMFEELTGSAFTFLDDFVTRMITSTYVTGDAPYIIDYSSTARFNPFSTVFLSEEQLDEALNIAFTGVNLDSYAKLLEDLPSDNVFRNAQVFFGDSEVRSAQRSDNSNAAGIAAAAVAATLVAAGVVLYRRRQKMEDKTSKDLDKKGDRTVAGETYTGCSYDGTGSVGGSLEHVNRSRDEEDEEAARSKSALGTLTEDDDSVRPRWGTTRKSSYDEGGSRESDAGAVPPSQSFDQMALQGLATAASGSLISKASIDDQSTATKRRPRTVEEIEAMLCTDNDDDEVSLVLSTRSRSGGNASASFASSSQRPRTVEEIESLLAEGLDDDVSASSALDDLE